MVIRVETVWYRLLEWWAIADMTSQIGPLCLISQRGLLCYLTAGCVPLHI